MASSELVHTQWTDGQILSAGSIFASGSINGNRVSGLNHIANAVNYAPRLVYSDSGISWTGSGTATVGSFSLSGLNLTNADHLHVVLYTHSRGGTETYYLRYSGAGVADVPIGSFGGLGAFTAGVWYDFKIATELSTLGSDANTTLTVSPNGALGSLVSASLSVGVKNWITGSSMFMIQAISTSGLGSNIGRCWVYAHKG